MGHRESEHIVQQVLASLERLKARDIVSLDVRKMTGVTDYMIIGGGTSTQHIKSIANQVVRDAKQNKLDVIGVEGQNSAEWVLIDLNDVVVHLMLPEQRKLYQLESLWQVMAEEGAETKAESTYSRVGDG